jgi:hypothetical protein
VHKSAIINMEKVVLIEGNAILLKDKTELILGASYREAFISKLNDKLIRTKRSPGS